MCIAILYLKSPRTQHCSDLHHKDATPCVFHLFSTWRIEEKEKHTSYVLCNSGNLLIAVLIVWNPNVGEYQEKKYNKNLRGISCERNVRLQSRHPPSSIPFLPLRASEKHINTDVLLYKLSLAVQKIALVLLLDKRAHPADERNSYQCTVGQGRRNEMYCNGLAGYH